MQIPYGYTQFNQKEVTINSKPGLLIQAITDRSLIFQESEAVEITYIKDQIQNQFREIQRSIYIENPYLLKPETHIFKSTEQLNLFASELTQQMTPHTLTPQKYQEFFGVFLGSKVKSTEKGLKETREVNSYFYYPQLDQIRLRTKSTFKNFYPGKSDNFELTNKFFDLNNIDLPQHIQSHFDTLKK